MRISISPWFAQNWYASSRNNAQIATKSDITWILCLFCFSFSLSSKRRVACGWCPRLLVSLSCRFRVEMVSLQGTRFTFLVWHENRTHTRFVHYWIRIDCEPIQFREWYCARDRFASVCACSRTRRPILLAFSCSCKFSPISHTHTQTELVVNGIFYLFQCFH